MTTRPPSEPAPDAEPVLALRGVGRDHVTPGGRVVRAVGSVDLDVHAHETLCLIGTSGSGKTTLLKLMNRLLEPSRGRVLLEGQDAAELDVVALRRRMGYVIQAGGLFPHMTVGRNIGLLCELEGWDATRREARVRELLELVQLPPDTFAGRWPRELSGGQRQRVGVARALALDPPILLMDEPFGALDPITRHELRREFTALEASMRKTIVFVTHDMHEAFMLADRVALLDHGSLAQVGHEQDFRDRPASAFVSEFLAAHFEPEGAGRA